ncbi:MAG: DUF3501 family protein [Alphaproteobacteria bacterium]|nr:DUF3501 family protein [Alphaproteobacteria bacterium]
MGVPERRIDRRDLMTMEDYGRIRQEKRRAISELKKNRRLAIGPFATLYFESYDTMWMQIHEMLYVERGGEDQIAGELAAYNPLIPQGNEIIATLMFEIDDPARRSAELQRLGGVEHTVGLRIASERIVATIIGEEERTRDDGKTSAVHFFRFVMDDRQVALFKDQANEAMFSVTHPNYGHLAMIPAGVRQALIGDLS